MKPDVSKLSSTIDSISIPFKSAGKDENLQNAQNVLKIISYWTIIRSFYLRLSDNLTFRTIFCEEI